MRSRDTIQCRAKQMEEQDRRRQRRAGQDKAVCESEFIMFFCLVFFSWLTTYIYLLEGILTFRRYFSFQASNVVVRSEHPFSSKTHHFYGNNIGCSELEKYGYSERSSKNKRMFVKIFNGCSERQRHAHFC
jgi:hypothetical protein